MALGDLAWTHLAIVPQSLGLLEELSLRENVALAGRFAFGAQETSWAAVELLLDQLGLRSVAARPPAQSSLGEQQRAAVARALVLAPELVLADEPTAHQDAHWADRIFRLLRAAADKGAACLVATHSAEGLEYADRVLEMRHGRMGEAAVPRD
jgi:putative ABC transport system ATP-binding protein